MHVALNAIHQIAIHSSDLDRSIEFYRDRLGVEFIAKFEPPGLAFFKFGQTRLLLERPAPRGTLYFRVDDITAAAKSLRTKGVELREEPRVIHRDKTGLFGAVGEEEWMAFFSDPDGNTLAIASRKRPAA